ncbi:MAG: imidazole glycerol phosphate synthase subunit HisH [Desulfobacterales bacterium]|nr:imidazole glycerol phosphate synthase subunit HisH [Desulfobacterales bacterium]
MIAIVNYGLGNEQAFANIYKNLGIPFKIASTIDDLKGATKIILPGVGAYDYAMELLQKSGMRESLDELVLQRKLPVLGVCVGMQILALSSEEGSLPGLGWIDGVVKKIDTSALTYKTHLPHMGWNDVTPVKNNTLFQGIEKGGRFYFLHSYYFQCHNDEELIAVTEYGNQFASAVNLHNIYGVQFHPEKSHQNGILLLKNFGNL